jgi:hypothetical protein
MRNFLLGHGWNLLFIHTIVLALIGTGGDASTSSPDGSAIAWGLASSEITRDLRVGHRANAKPGCPQRSVRAEAASAGGAKRRAWTDPRTARQSTARWPCPRNRRACEGGATPWASRPRRNLRGQDSRESRGSLPPNWRPAPRPARSASGADARGAALGVRAGTSRKIRWLPAVPVANRSFRPS